MIAGDSGIGRDFMEFKGIFKGFNQQMGISWGYIMGYNKIKGFFGGKVLACYHGFYHQV